MNSFNAVILLPILIANCFPKNIYIEIGVRKSNYVTYTAMYILGKQSDFIQNQWRFTDVMECEVLLIVMGYFIDDSPHILLYPPPPSSIIPITIYLCTT